MSSENQSRQKLQERLEGVWSIQTLSRAREGLKPSERPSVAEMDQLLRLRSLLQDLVRNSEDLELIQGVEGLFRGQLQKMFHLKWAKMGVNDWKWVTLTDIEQKEAQPIEP